MIEEFKTLAVLKYGWPPDQYNPERRQRIEYLTNLPIAFRHDLRLSTSHFGYSMMDEDYEHHYLTPEELIEHLATWMMLNSNRW